ncbi:MAG: SufD family Fe-S cluster assembly protein [bacterium]|nr:SufD family Fe-S cluster assembly protein [bacterium]
MTDNWEREFVFDQEAEQRKYVFIFQGKVPERVNLSLRLAARNTRVEVVSVFLGKGNMRSKINFTVSHEAPETFGRILFKAALFDESRVDFAGMLKIAKGADGSDSYLQARALLVSSKAMARLDPGLEILANNVKASHGATVGRLREQDVFYLQSRGLSKEDAGRMLVTGFFSDALRMMPEEVNEKVSKFL